MRQHGGLIHYLRHLVRLGKPGLIEITHAKVYDKDGTQVNVREFDPPLTIYPGDKAIISWEIDYGSAQYEKEQRGDPDR